ncbi:MAG TPA: lipoprotein insertase outer membrane protein LolB [Rhodanobacteraceae bacterium]
MRRPAAWCAFAVLAGMVLAGCAPLPVRSPGNPGTAAQLAAQAARGQQLGAVTTWGIDGRFAASDGRHGGSGSLAWQQQGQHYSFTLRAPITGKTVQLEGGPEGAVLTGVDKQPLAGSNASTVLTREFGWNVPVADLAFWVRGLRAPGTAAVLTFGADGLPATLDQDGWHVDYRAWYADRTPPLPRKVYASRGPYTVRVLIEQWHADP